MRQSRLMVLAAAAGLAGALAAGAAHAQTTPDPMAAPAAMDAAATAGDAAATAAKPKKHKAKHKAAEKKMPTVAVVVTNERKVGLVELDAVTAGGADSVKIAGPLAAGKKTVAHVAHDKDCLFDLRGTYEDSSTFEAQSVDLCKEKKINLVE